VPDAPLALRLPAAQLLPLGTVQPVTTPALFQVMVLVPPLVIEGGEALMFTVGGGGGLTVIATFWVGVW